VCNALLRWSRSKVVPIEGVDAQFQRAVPPADELTTQDEGLGRAIGFGLCAALSLDIDAPRVSVTEQRQEPLRVIGQADRQDLADARQHLLVQPVANHLLVVHWQQRLVER
jgi:hypothetical protein